LNRNDREDSCSCKKIILIALLLSVLIGLAVYFIIRMKMNEQPELNIRSSDPIIPEFEETSGIMNAPKIKPIY